MRLTEFERAAILEAVRRGFGPDAEVWLFGSRVDDSRQGGDIDLYVETPDAGELLSREFSTLDAIEEHLGERKIDLIVRPRTRPPRPIEALARKTGIKI